MPSLIFLRSHNSELMKITKAGVANCLQWGPGHESDLFIKIVQSAILGAFGVLALVTGLITFAVNTASGKQMDPIDNY